MLKILIISSKIKGKVMHIDYIKLLNINNITHDSMTLTDDKITDIFYLIDNFCQEFDNSVQ